MCFALLSTTLGTQNVFFGNCRLKPNWGILSRLQQILLDYIPLQYKCIFHAFQNWFTLTHWTEPSFALILFKVRTSLRLCEHELAGSKTWLGTRVTQLRNQNQDSQHLTTPRCKQVTDNDTVHATLISIHSFICTHQRGRGDELSTSIHHDRTWWSGQSSELVLYQDMLLHEKSTYIKHRHATPHSTDNDTSLTGTKCTKLRRHSSKVKISLKPNVVAKNAR